MSDIDANRKRLRTAYQNGELSKSQIAILELCEGWHWVATHNNKQKTDKQFRAELARINPNIEPLDKYINAHLHIRMRCKVCNHIWKIDPRHLLNGTGCPYCAGRGKTTKSFKTELAQKNPNDIEVVSKYTGARNYLEVRCKKCNFHWKSLPTNLLKGYGCPRCKKHGKRSVLCCETGVIYESISEAARATNVTQPAISCALKDHSRTADSYHWEYVN